MGVDFDAQAVKTMVGVVPHAAHESHAGTHRLTLPSPIHTSGLQATLGISLARCFRLAKSQRAANLRTDRCPGVGTRDVRLSEAASLLQKASRTLGWEAAHQP